MFSLVWSCPKPSLALPKTPSPNERRTRIHTTYSPKSNPSKVKWQVGLEWIGFAVSRANFGICGWEKHQVWRKDILQCLYSLLPRLHPVVLTDWLLVLRKSQTLCSYRFFSPSVLVNDSAELTKWMFSEPWGVETFHFEHADWSKLVVCCSHFLMTYVFIFSQRLQILMWSW